MIMYINSCLYTMKFCFVPILYNLGCMWILGVAFQCVQNYILMAIIGRMKLSNISAKCE